MKWIIRTSCLIMTVIIMLTTGCAKTTAIVPIISPVPKQVSAFTEEECPFKDRLPPEEKVTCGSLAVPEDRNNPTSQEIQISVVVFKSNAEKPQPDPLLVLMGYIGQATRFSDYFSYRFGDLAGDRDLIIADFRGVGDAEPNLDCPELRQAYGDTLNLELYSNEFNDKILAAHKACYNRLSNSQINLSAYTPDAIASDLEDLRIALGYDEWNIYAAGFSTRLSLELMRMYPDPIRSVVLDSVYPPQVNYLAEQAMNAQQSLNLFFQRCANNEKCIAAFPNLENVFYAQVDKYNAHPIMVNATDLSSGDQTQVLMSGDRLLELVIYLMNSPSQNSLSEVPRMIYQLQKDNTQKLAEYLGDYIDSFGASDTALGSILFCAEEVRFTSLEDVQKATAKADPEIRKLFNLSHQLSFASCDAWGILKAPNENKKPVKSNVPTLLLSGDYDWEMPPAWAKLAAQSLKNSYYFEFPETGIYVIFSSLWWDCGSQIMKEFYSNPNKQPDGKCTQQKKDFLWITIP